MPAVSESGVTLPHTWRPMGVRLASAFFFVMLIVVAAFAWVGFDAEVRDQFTWPQKLTLLGLGAAIGSMVVGFFRTKVVADEEGVTSVNVFRTHRAAWSDITAVRMPSGAPWAYLKLADGSKIQLYAFQGSDGARATNGVKELRALLPQE